MLYSSGKSNKASVSNPGRWLFFSGIILVILGIIFRTSLGEWVENEIPGYFNRYYPAIIISLISFVIILFYEIKRKLKDFHRLDLAKMLNPIYEKLDPIHQKIKYDKNLNKLSGAMIKEAAVLISDLGGLNSGSKYIVNDEYKRVQLIRHLFNSQPEKEIFAVTYDYQNYFLNFWGPVLTPSFLDANKNAAQKAVITRIFIFNKEDYEKSQEKQERFNQIKEQISKLVKQEKGLKKINTIIIWEHSLPGNFSKQSFLIIDDWITSACQFELSDGYVAFGNEESISQLKIKKEKLLDIVKSKSVIAF